MRVSAFIAINALLLVFLTGCMGYVPFRQTYWDQEVKALCEKDGGMTIYERIRITKAVIDSGVHPVHWTGSGIGLGERRISVAIKSLAHPKALVYAENKSTVIREYNPRVSRSEWLFIRRSDQAVVARYISYGRHGGDFPTGIAHGSSFRCPALNVMSEGVNEIFLVVDGSQ